MESFTRFALVGGIPKYWEFVRAARHGAGSGGGIVLWPMQAFLEDEPGRILRDEFAGLTALSVLEAVGRGAEKTSEIAARLGTAQTILSRAFSTIAGRLGARAGDSVWRKRALRPRRRHGIGFKTRRCDSGFRSIHRTARAGRLTLIPLAWRCAIPRAMCRQRIRSHWLQ